jgi:hypothetical protein
MSYRIEKKILLKKNNLIKFNDFMYENKIKKIFDDRIISSVYFDNKYSQSFIDSEEGIVPRKKIRIRYYNYDQLKKFKEIKVTDSIGRKKTSKVYDLNILESSFFDDQYGVCRPKLLVIYKRSYFFFKKLRITLDTNIKYQKVLFNNTLKTKIYSDDNFVLEIKSNNLKNENYVNTIFPFQFSRFSKYCNGIINIK